MSTVSHIATFDLIAGSLSALGLLYLLYSDTMVVHYRRFFRLIAFGLLLYAVTGPIVGTFAPEYIHAIHGAAVLSVALGLYDLVHDDITPERDLDALLDLSGAEFDPDADPSDD